MRIFILAALVLFILGLICTASETTIAGADWPTWLMGGLVAWLLDTVLGGIDLNVGGRR